MCVSSHDQFHLYVVQTTFLCSTVYLPTVGDLCSCCLCTQWYGPPSAKKIRAGQDYDLMTAVEDAAKFVEVKVERMDNIALTLQHINDRIVNQDRLWYHLRQSDEPDVAEDNSTDASGSYADSGEGQEEVFVQTVRNLAPVESKDQPVQVSVIVDPKKVNSAPRGDNDCHGNGLPAVAQLMPTLPGQQQMYATFTPGMGMKFFVLPQGWNCYQVCNTTPSATMTAPPNPPTNMTGSTGSVSPRDSLDSHSTGAANSSDIDSEGETEYKKAVTPSAQVHPTDNWPAVPIVQIDNVE